MQPGILIKGNDVESIAPIVICVMIWDTRLQNFTQDVKIDGSNASGLAPFCYR